MACQTPNKRALVELVQKCVSENSYGFIQREQFIKFCSELNASIDELDNVFNELDTDKDGRINVNDFTKTFEQISSYETEDSYEVNVASSSDKSLYECRVDPLESPLQVISPNGQQYISELYYNLTNSNQPDLLDLFEKHLASVVKDIKSKAAENQRLEEALKRATKQHERQVNNLDREVEQQMEKLEEKVRQEEKSTYDKKLSDITWQLESKEKEISAMNKTIETLETRLEKETKKPNMNRKEIENAAQENRFLKSQITDSQTTLALLRSELAELRSQFVEQSDQLAKEQITARACMQEQENLARQLQLLYEANQRLQDVNDELRGALEAKRNSSSPERKISSEVLNLSTGLTDVLVNRKLSENLHSNGSTKGSPTRPRLREYQTADYNDNTLNEDSLFSEIHRASTYEKNADERTCYETTTTYDDITNTLGSDSSTSRKTNSNLQNQLPEQRTALAKIMTALAERFKKPIIDNAKASRFDLIKTEKSPTSNDECTTSPNSSLSPFEMKANVSNKESDVSFDCTYGEFENDLNSGYLSNSYSFPTICASSFLHNKPYKSDPDDDEAYGTMSNSRNRKAEVQKQIQILEDTNKRLSSSNDELRVALKMMARSGSFRKPKKTSSGGRRAQSSHSDYSSLSSNRSSRSFSPNHKRLSNGDIGEATDESTTYEVEDENVVTIDEEYLLEIVGKSEENEVSVNQTKETNINDKKNVQSVETFEDETFDETEPSEVVEEEAKNLSLERVENDRTDYELCFSERNKLHRHNMNEKNLDRKRFGTRSKSLELVQNENFGSLQPSSQLVREFDVTIENYNCATFDGKNTGKESSNVKFQEEIEKKNTGLWQITRRLNAFERTKSSRKDLSRIEEENFENDSDCSLKFEQDELRLANELGEKERKRSIEDICKKHGFKKEGLEANTLPLFGQEERKDLVICHDIDSKSEDCFTGERIESDSSKNISCKNVGLVPNERRFLKQRVDKYLITVKVPDGEENQNEFLNKNGFEKESLKNSKLESLGLVENNNDMLKEGDKEETRDVLQACSLCTNQASVCHELSSIEEEAVDSLDDEEWYDENEEFSNDKELPDSSLKQCQDSSATMNSETIADLENQFQKIQEINEGEEEIRNLNDPEDDSDDDDEIDPAELAELVAMASDLTDVSDSDSEADRSRSNASNKTEEIATMTTESLSLSNGTPERMYKLVLAGDAAVGKSSFILRLCKNKFHSSLNATLGVDFQVKNLKVDSKTIALQLWDTAGQERFRSIAKSYFRKVDGVLLLYDVTSESSFVNIRDWMTTIEESANKKVPIMLCGNKCDLREEYIMEGRKVISYESGHRLAKHYDALFIETSAKDGSRIEESCKELARILTTLENEEIQQSGLKLEKRDKDKKKRQCCRS